MKLLKQVVDVCTKEIIIIIIIIIIITIIIIIIWQERVQIKIAVVVVISEDMVQKLEVTLHYNNVVGGGRWTDDWLVYLE